jgi:AGCS family alanine or glycine:cation symporter
MAIPSLVALLLLNGVIIAETRKYLWEGSINDIARD